MSLLRDVYATLRRRFGPRVRIAMEDLLREVSRRGQWPGLQRPNPWRWHLKAKRRALSKYPKPHQGKRECARRVRQMNRSLIVR